MVCYFPWLYQQLCSLYYQIDCSHGNSSKQHQRQIEVGEDIVSSLSKSAATEPFLKVLSQAQQLQSGDTAQYIMGVMLESNLFEGRQDIPSSGPSGLKYGQSVTDACISWEHTVPVLDRLRLGVQGRRLQVRQAACGGVATQPSA